VITCVSSAAGTQCSRAGELKAADGGGVAR
jgi:hypothetical protein